MSRTGERGAALVAAVGTLAALSVLAVGFAGTTVLETQRTAHALAALQAEALARSGVAATLVVLGERDPALPDLAGARWGSGRQPLGAGTVEVDVEDEARRLDCFAPELPRLFAALGLDPRAVPTFVAPPEERRFGPSLGDRARAAGLSVAAARALVPFVTTTAEPRVNPNTASPQVLLALTGDRGLVATWLRTRADAAIDLAAVPPALATRLTDRGQFYRVRSTGVVGAARRTLEAIVDAPAGVEPRLVSARPRLADLARDPVPR